MKKLVSLLLSIMVVFSACKKSETLNHKHEISLANQSIGVTSVHNARQLGGYCIGEKRIKTDLLLRSGALAELSGQDSALLSERFKLQRIYDFRGANEAAAAPDVLPGKSTYLSLSVSFVEGQDSSDLKLDDRQSMIKFLLENAELPQIQALCAGMYDQIFFDESSQEVYRRFFSDLLEQDPKNGAILWHCTQGKDRAGSASAMLLAALGADRDLIMKDFILSKEYYDPHIAEIEVKTEAQKTVISTLLSANPVIFAQTLDKVNEKYGSLIGYLTDCIGVTPEMMAILRDRYLEE